MYVPHSFSHFLLTPNPETYPTQERHGNARPSTASQIRHLKSSVSLSLLKLILFVFDCPASSLLLHLVVASRGGGRDALYFAVHRAVLGGVSGAQGPQ